MRLREPIQHFAEHLCSGRLLPAARPMTISMNVAAIRVKWLRSAWPALVSIAFALTVAAASGVALGADWRNVEAPASADRTMLISEILNRFEPSAVEAGAHSPAWREMFATQLKAMDSSTLRSLDLLRLRTSADAKAAYAQFTEAVRGAEMQLYQTTYSGKAPLKLGSTTTDQVFIPIAPCRIVDTRNVGGMIAAGTTRNFYFYASNSSFDWSTQGGAAGAASSTCPGTINPNGGAPSAAVVTVTVVSPSAAGNWIIWGGANPIPTISALNWNAGDIDANTTIIPGGGRSSSGPGGPVKDFAVAYNGPSGSAHFVADVVGY